jgi:hypothetical protein
MAKSRARYDRRTAARQATHGGSVRELDTVGGGRGFHAARIPWGGRPPRAMIATAP